MLPVGKLVSVPRTTSFVSFADTVVVPLFSQISLAPGIRLDNGDTGSDTDMLTAQSRLASASPGFLTTNLNVGVSPSLYAAPSSALTTINSQPFTTTLGVAISAIFDSPSPAAPNSAGQNPAIANPNVAAALTPIAINCLRVIKDLRLFTRPL